MIRLGLIGLGQAAQLLHLPNLEKMQEHFQITAVADISASLTSYIADKYQVPHRFRDGMDLIRCPDVDAVMILAAGDHAEYAIAALEAGKHVFIEKPMTTDMERAEALMEAKRRHPELVAMVGYCRRYNDSFLKMKALLDADNRPISYVRARTLVLEGPWYLENTWHERKADDLDPAGRAEMQRKMLADYNRILGGHATEAQIWAYLLLTASGCHIVLHADVGNSAGYPGKDQHPQEIRHCRDDGFEAAGISDACAPHQAAAANDGGAYGSHEYHGAEGPAGNIVVSSVLDALDGIDADTDHCDQIYSNDYQIPHTDFRMIHE